MKEITTISNSLPDGFVMRPVTMADVPSVVNLLNACAVDLIGKPEWDEGKLRVDWESPVFDLKNDACAVIAPSGELVGYVDVWDIEPHVRIYSIGSVHPAYQGLGIGTALCEWSEWRGNQSIPKAPKGARVVLLSSLLSNNEPAQDLLQNQGFLFSRYSYQMLIDLVNQPPEPAVPQGITIRRFIRGEEERDVIQAVRDAFKDHWGYVERPFEEELNDWLHWMDNDEDFDPSLWFVATGNGEIAGISLCYPKMVEDPQMGWVSTLGVRRPWRRRGVALALLHHSFGEFYRRGQQRVGLGVDAESITGATRLYEKAGMYVQRRYNNYQKELRPGKDLSTRVLQE